MGDVLTVEQIASLTGLSKHHWYIGDALPVAAPGNGVTCQ